MFKKMVYFFLTLQLGTLNHLPHFRIINKYYGYKIRIPLTNPALSYIDPLSVTRNRYKYMFQRNCSKNGSFYWNNRNMVKNVTEETESVQFKSPKVLLGHAFDESLTKRLCETCTLSSCNTVTKIEYTNVGKKICSKICFRQNQLIFPIRPTKVNLMHSYCTKIGLKLATCVCAFRVSTKENVNFLFFHYTPNDKGYLAMIYFEAGLPYQ